MGSSSSRMASRPGSEGGTRFRLSSLLCGTSFSDDPPHQMESQSDDTTGIHDVNSNLQSLVKESCPVLSAEGERSRQSYHNTSPCQNNCAESSNSGKHLTECKELIPRETNDGPRGDLSASMEEADSTNASGSETCPDRFCPSNTSHQEPDHLSMNAPFIGSQADEVMAIRGPRLNSISTFSDTSTTRQPSRNEPLRESNFLGSGFLTALGSRERRNGSVLHVDLVSVSSNILRSSTEEMNNHEARRNSRRLFWDAFSRRSSRRNDDPQSIFFSTEDSDDQGSHDRWLLDFSSDGLDNGVEDDSGSLSSRRHGADESRRRSRSEIWERFRVGLGGSSGNTALCASGLHPDGTCSCEALLIAEGLSTRASISRIVVLAEALFEVLDEIHRQPLSFSLSMSRPAPESVVDSFPLKTHEKSNMHGIGEDAEQCYICLAEYEEGDKIRTLPCRHEYHMSCVDKWLKEIHGVCPLCRGDVCEGVAGCPVSDSSYSL